MFVVAAVIANDLFLSSVKFGDNKGAELNCEILGDYRMWLVLFGELIGNGEIMLTVGGGTIL